MTVAAQLDQTATDDGSSHRQQLILESAFVVLLMATALILRLWGLSKVHFWDETVYLQNAEVICCGKANYSELASRPPLLSLFFASVFLLWHHVYAACAATALLNAFGPVLMYLCGRMIAGRIPAAIASLLLAFLPFFVGVFPAGFVSDDTGNSLLSDSPALTLILLSFWLLLRALREQTDFRFASAGFALALAVLMRFAVISSVGVLSLLVLAADRRWRAVLACGAGSTAGIAPYLFWSHFRYGGFLTPFRSGWEHFEGPVESSFFYLNNFVNIFSWITIAGLVLWISQWAWGNWGPKGRDHPLSPLECTDREHSRRFEAFLLLWAIAVLLFFSVLPHKEPRYVMPLAPPLLLLAGIGLGVLLKGRQTATRVAGTVLLVGALAYTFLPVRQRFESSFIDDGEVSEEMEVSDFLNRSVPSATILYSNFNYPVFAYYTNLQVRRVLGTGPALYDSLNHLPGDGILIAYKENGIVTDPRLDWLDSNPHFRRFRAFSSLVLYKYHAGKGR